MFYEEVTDRWSAERKNGGIYIVRSTVPGKEGVVRVGAGGGGSNKSSLFRRLYNHTSEQPKNKTCETHYHQPYGVVRAWGLKDFTVQQITCAEHCLYRAFAIRFLRLDSKKDRSHFLVPASYDFTELFAEVEADLASMTRVV